MIGRKLLLATIVAFLCQSYCQEYVFVDINRLAVVHPAWQIAERVSKEQKQTAFSLQPLNLRLSGVQNQFQLDLVEESKVWAEGLLKAWDDEIEAIKRRQSKFSGWQLQLALPTLPLVDPYARWEFIVQQKEKQMAERIRLNLRLAFSDLLSHQEKFELEKRKSELDAALEQPTSMHQLPIFLEFQRQEIDLSSPQPLTEPSKIHALVAQPFEITQQTFSIELVAPDIVTQHKFRLNPSQSLKSMAMELARSFALACAKNRGWKVTFKREPNLPDVTEEVLREWKGRLNWLSLKE